MVEPEALGRGARELLGLEARPPRRSICSGGGRPGLASVDRLLHPLARGRSRARRCTSEMKRRAPPRRRGGVRPLRLARSSAAAAAPRRRSGTARGGDRAAASPLIRPASADSLRGVTRRRRSPGGARALRERSMMTIDGLCETSESLDDTAVVRQMRRVLSMNTADAPSAPDALSCSDRTAVACRQHAAAQKKSTTTCASTFSAWATFSGQARRARGRAGGLGLGRWCLLASCSWSGAACGGVVARAGLAARRCRHVRRGRTW